MMHWLTTLWRTMRRLPHLPTGQVKWDTFDCDQWAGFLASPTGRKLLFMLTVTEHTQAVQAVASADRFACGIAFGWRAHNEWLRGLGKISAPPAPQDGPSEKTGAEGASDLFDRLAP